MTNSSNQSDGDTRKIAVAITDFLRDQFLTRNDLDLKDRCNLEIAAQCLEKAYGIVGNSSLQNRFSRPLIDIFKEVKYPVSVEDKILADAHNEDGNNYMRRNMAISAEIEYTAAIDLNKWNSIYYCNRASAKIEQRRFIDAIADCKKALALNPDYAKAYARMGQAFSLTSLTDRHQTAAQCFRKALEWDPENERYKLNLRVAESHSTGPGSSQMATRILTSVLRIGSRIHRNNNSTILPPTSFVVINEIRRPISSTSAQTTVDSQTPQIVLKDKKDEQTNKNSMTTCKESNDITFPTPSNKEAEQQIELKFKLPSKIKDDRKDLIPEKLGINTPLSTHSFDFVPKTQPPASYVDGSRSNVKIMDVRPAKELQSNISIMPQHATEVKSENVDIQESLLEDFCKREVSLQEFHKLSSFIEQEDNNPEIKSTTQACVNGIKNKATRTEKGTVEKEEIFNAYMPSSSNLKIKIKLCEMNSQECDTPSFLTGQKYDYPSDKSTTETNVNRQRQNEKSIETINKTVEKEMTALSLLKGSSGNKQKNRVIKNSTKDSLINSRTSFAGKSQDNSNNSIWPKHYFTVAQCAILFCSALLYFKWRFQ